MAQDQKRALLAVVLSGLILFGWQYFFAPKPQYDAKPVETSSTSTEVKDVAPDIVDSGVVEAPVGLVEIVLENDTNSYKLNNELSVVDALFRETGSEMHSFFSPSNNGIQFLIGDVYKSIQFDLQKVSSTKASFSSIDGVSGTVELSDKGYLVYSINSVNPFKYRFVFKETLEEDSSGSFLAMGGGAAVKQFAYYTDEYNTLTVDGAERGEALISWVSVDNDYHLFANVLDGKKLLKFHTNEKGVYDLRSPDKVGDLKFKQIFARKEYDYLTGLGHNLQQSIDFGIWAIIAVPILRGLQFFYSIFPNYGISIILLTIIIRMLTFPLQFKSFKSMKKMQEIQPELTKLREKFKDNPQKMQQETMSLFKKAGANPLGGCLPLILQMPVFFAFYRVLYSSVELVDAPFYFWIHDLSEKDPFYVLPVLMGLAMVLNQKLMPTSISDPVQKKVMLFMPLIFAVFMKDFPAGLTLYIFVSTLMGMGQQLFVYKRT
ncbi:MAG: membrane protein insertase YidC [Bacteriovoracaceae bacterium]|nr:membrane protein insertase YidC [Bacteriovoracaceae bacterium]